MTSFESKSFSTYKLPAKYTSVVFAFFMSGIMAFLMSLVIVAANSGISSGYLELVIHAYAHAMPVAFACVLVVRPLVMKLVAWTVQPHSISK